MNMEKNDRPKITKLTFFQFAAVCGNLRSFCGFLRSFCGLQFAQLRPKKQKMNVFGPSHFGLVKISLNSFAGAMRHAKLEIKYAISEDLCVWHVLGICDRFRHVVRFANAQQKCYERGYRYI